jgi:hypothetical protein
MRADRLWAGALPRALQPSHRHLVVSQALLPALEEAGAPARRSLARLARGTGPAAAAPGAGFAAA